MATTTYPLPQFGDVRQMRFFNSIRGRLILFTLVLAWLPLLALAIVTYVAMQNTMRTTIEDGLDGTGSSKVIDVDHWLDGLNDHAAAIAGIPSIAGDGDRVTAIGLDVIIRFEDNPESVAYQQAYNAALQTLEQTVAHEPAIQSAMLFDVDGDVIVTTDDIVMQGTNASDYPTIPFEEGVVRPFTSDVVLSVDGVTPILVFLYPIDALNGERIGVLMFRVLIDAIREIMEDTSGLGTTGETYLVGYNANDGVWQMVSESRFSPTGTTTILQQEVDTFGVQQALGGTPTGIGNYKDYRGVDVLGVWHYISHDDAPDWVLLAEIDEAEAFAPINNLARLSVVFVIGAGLLTAFGAYMISGALSRPIVQVSEAAAGLASGDLTRRVDVNNRDEIGVLANSFNAMAGDLEKMVENERFTRAYLEETVTDYMTFVEEVSAGNLRTRLTLNGNGNGNHVEDAEHINDDLHRLGENLNYMVENLASMASQFREVAQSVSTAATEIQAATTQQTASATEQDAAVSQTVATVEEVRTTVVQTAERAQTVAETSQKSVNVSMTGQQAVEESVQGMDLIRQRVESIAETILMLSERTQQIGEIINTVNALADQSKLLALNASIEAARAGEEGKGFAVVAMEVRQLAEESREATSRVRDILSEIQQATNTAVMVTEEGSKGAESGLSLVQRAGESIRELAGTIESAAQNATQIAASTHQQTNGMDQLASAMMQIKQSSAQTAATMQQTEQSVRDLLAMARQLEEAAARYQL